MSALPNVALSLRQPWAHAVVHGGKRIENRVLWENSHFRGEFLIHASKGMTRKEWEDARAFALARKVAWVPPDPKRLDGETRKPMVLERGGIVGVARVVGVVVSSLDGISAMVRELAPGVAPGYYAPHVQRELTPLEHKWWMGAFALVLDDVRPLPFVPCKGMLGFFKLGPDVMSELVRAGAR